MVSSTSLTDFKARLESDKKDQPFKWFICHVKKPVYLGPSRNQVPPTFVINAQN